MKTTFIRTTLKQLFLTAMLGCSLSLSAATATATATATKNTEQFSGINNISFYDTRYNKNFAGNGFLIRYQNKLYAVTVKHTFLEAKTPEMKHIAIEGHVNEWRIHPNKNPNEYVKLGKLLNADTNETIDMNVLQKDWLVFEVAENHSNLAILTLRDTPLISGEQLKAYGCSYANQTKCQQDIYTGNFIANEPHNIRIKMPDLALSTLRGLSGSPVLDKNNNVVGIVSNVMKSTSGEGFDFAPANLDYLLTVLKSLSNTAM